MTATVSVQYKEQDVDERVIAEVVPRNSISITTGAEYEELSSLCKRLLLEQDALRAQVEKQAEVIQVIQIFFKFLTPLIIYAILNPRIYKLNRPQHQPAKAFQIDEQGNLCKRIIFRL